MIAWGRGSACAACVSSALGIAALLAGCGGTSSQSTTTSSQSTTTSSQSTTTSSQSTTTQTTAVGSTGAWRAVEDSGPYAAQVPSCVSASTCLAIDDNVIIRTADGGSSWVVSLKAGTSSDIALSDITCTVALCIAVGVNGTATQAKAFVSSDLGRSWQAANLPVPAGADGIEVDGVSCGTPESCVAVGEDNGEVFAWSTSNAGHKWDNLILLGTFSDFSAIACTSAEFCVAASGLGLVVTTTGPAGFAFAPHTPASWDSSGAGANAVSCAPGTRWCMAVGSQGECLVGGTCSPAVVATSDGGSNWTSASNLPTGLGYFSAVSCVSPGNCVAGGYEPGKSLEESGPPSSTYLLVSEGGADHWKTIPVHEMASGSLDGLAGVSCGTASFCLTGGSVSAGSPPKSYELIGPA